jgi:hypothetical protein
MNCPDCEVRLDYFVSDDKNDINNFHLYEICTHCGYNKTYIDYKD